MLNKAVNKEVKLNSYTIPLTDIFSCLEHKTFTNILKKTCLENNTWVILYFIKTSTTSHILYIHHHFSIPDV